MSHHNTLILIVALLLAIVALAVLQTNERSRRAANLIKSFDKTQQTSSLNSNYLNTSYASDL